MTENNSVVLAERYGLPRVGARPPLREYLHELWQRRHFATTMARFRIEATTSENRLGLAWIVLNPLLQAAVYGVIFGFIMTKSTRPANFIPFLLTGFFIFTYFSGCFSQGAKAITSNSSLVRSLSFPRMLLPMSAVLRKLFELVPMMVVLVAIVIPFGEYPNWKWLLVPVIIGLMTMFNFGIALIAARITVHVRDFTNIIPVLTRFLFYMTGIFYSLELTFRTRPHLLLLADLNPVHAYISLVRWAMLAPVVDPDTGDPLTINLPFLWGSAVVAAVVSLTLGVFFFWKAEERYGRD